MEIIFSFVFFAIIFVGFIALFFFISRRMSAQILKGTSATYLNLSGVAGEAKVLSVRDTGINVANTYFTYEFELEITSLNPTVMTKAEGTFLKAQIPQVGAVVKVKYDPKNPKIALVTT